MIHCLKERGYGSIEDSFDPYTNPDPLIPKEGTLTFEIIDTDEKTIAKWEFKK